MASRRSLGSRKPSLEAIREVVQDPRTWVSIAVVTLHGGETSHYDIDGTDVLIDVLLVENDMPLLCKLSNQGGVYQIPRVGDEVIVCYPMGEITDNPTIVATLGSREPSGLSETTIVVMAPQGGNVLVHDGSADDAKELALKSDVQEIVDAITHAAVFAGDGGAVFKTNILSYLTNLQTPTGTSTLKAK